ncbi:hypothetical protein HDU81_003096 [Chytriomyces hyalinus]|nr:hypothetical protein HDU81_003096 [Chytriomyces hyalinus]
MRIASQSLQQNMNRTVVIVGRVVSYTGATAVIETCDGGSVTVLLVPGSNVDGEGIIVEVMGVVRSDLSIQEQVSSKFDDPNYDTNAYARLLEIAEKYPDLL